MYSIDLTVPIPLKEEYNFSVRILMLEGSTNSSSRTNETFHYQKKISTQASLRHLVRQNSLVFEYRVLQPISNFLIGQRGNG